MTTLVMNTLTGAVSEYDWEFQSFTETHAGDVTGLYELGGDKDALAFIEAEVQTGETLWDSSLKKRMDVIYYSIQGEGDAVCTVSGKTDSYEYNFPIRDAGESRAIPGKGIRENYLSFGLKNSDGGDFVLDRIEVNVVQSSSRRVA